VGLVVDNSNILLFIEKTHIISQNNFYMFLVTLDGSEYFLNSPKKCSFTGLYQNCFVEGGGFLLTGIVLGQYALGQRS
jgi:hypothetical protein